METFDLAPLPEKINQLLIELHTPQRLMRHLTIVHHTAHLLLTQIEFHWNSISIDKETVLFGAATHDIGKTKITEELFQKGKKHEETGRDLLIEKGFSPKYARFAFTHGNWSDATIELEDLIVALADKIWKGKRIDELEELTISKIAQKGNIDYWTVFTQIDLILEEISKGADKRLLWQNSGEN